MSNNNFNKGPFEKTLDKIQKRPGVTPKPTLKDRPVRKPNAVPPKTKTIKMKPSALDSIIPNIAKYSDMYDNRDDVIVDGNEIKLESQLRKEIAEREKIKRPKQYNHMDPTTYPMNQKKTLSTYEAVLYSAKKNPRDPNSIQTKRMLRKLYNKNPKQLQDDELKLIKKHPSQMKQEEEKPIINTVPITPIDYSAFKIDPTPKRDVREIISNSSRVKPGLTEDLISLQSQINKNVNYVLGRRDKKVESMNEKNINNKEETYD